MIVSALDLASTFPPNLVYDYLAVLSAVGIGAMGLDKGSAMLNSGRISEASLQTIAFAGGFAGVIFGGLLFHHKTSKPEFWVGIIVATIIWGAILTAYFFPWVFTF